MTRRSDRHEPGSFTIAGDPWIVPRTVVNYLAYVDGRFLDGGSVYRLVTLANQPAETRHKIEVVRWGMNLGDDKAPPLAPIAHESTRGSTHESTHETRLRAISTARASMARSAPGTAASEIFYQHRRSAEARLRRSPQRRRTGLRGVRPRDAGGDRSCWCCMAERRRSSSSSTSRSLSAASGASSESARAGS